MGVYIVSGGLYRLWCLCRFLEICGGFILLGLVYVGLFRFLGCLYCLLGFYVVFGLGVFVYIVFVVYIGLWIFCISLFGIRNSGVVYIVLCIFVISPSGIRNPG